MVNDKIIVEKLDGIATSTASINGKVDELLLWRAAMEERCTHHSRETISIKTTLYGRDGAAGGLVTDVQRLKNCKEDKKRSEVQYRGVILGVLQTLIATGIILVALWLMSLYRSGAGG